MYVIQVSYRGVDRDTRMKPNTEYKKKNNNNVTCYTEQLYISTGFLLLSMDTAETERKARDWCSYRGLPFVTQTAFLLHMLFNATKLADNWSS